VTLHPISANIKPGRPQQPGKTLPAATEFQEALRIRPDYREACMNLVNALVETPGKMPEAIAQFQAALRLKPDFAEARNYLARTCPTCAGR